MNAVGLTVGVLIALGIYNFGTKERYDQRIDVLRSNDVGWLYLSAFILRLGFLAIGINLGNARKASKVGLPNQQVYKVYTPSGAPQLGYVLMEEEGEIGAFNRAQRAFQVYLENAPQNFLYFVLAAFVFPFPCFVLTSLYAFFRAWAAVGYTSSTAGRGKGSMFGGFAALTAEGMVLIV